MLEFQFFVCSCLALPTPFVEGAIFTPFYTAAPFVKKLIDHRGLGLFWALGSVLLVYLSVFMPVPGCFDYSSLVIQFDIRYCDFYYFALLSQN